MPAMWEFSVVTSSQIPGAFAVKQMHRTRFYARQKVWPGEWRQMHSGSSGLT